MIPGSQRIMKWEGYFEGARAVTQQDKG